MIEVNLEHVPARGNRRDDQNHLQPDAVFIEVGFQCFQKFQSKYDGQNRRKRTLHRGEEGLCGFDLGNLVPQPLQNQHEDNNCRDDDDRGDQ